MTGLLKTITAGSLIVLTSLGLLWLAFPSMYLNNQLREIKGVEYKRLTFQLPNIMILNQATSDLGMEYFLEKSGLFYKIANRSLTEMGIHMSVELAYYDYVQFLRTNLPHSMLELATFHEDMKPHLINAIIQVSKVVDSNLKLEGAAL